MDKSETYNCAFLLCLCELITLSSTPKAPIHHADITIYDKTAARSGTIVANEI